VSKLISVRFGKQLTEKKKAKDKSDGGAHWRTEARKLFRSRFEMLWNTFIMRSTANYIS